MEGGTHTKQVPSPQVEKLLGLIGWLRSAGIKQINTPRINFSYFLGDTYFSVGFRDIYNNMSLHYSYNRYLQSDGWKDKKKELRKTTVKKCWVCNNTKNLQVHHITYNRIGREESGDLIYLCLKHHLDFHRKQKWMRGKDSWDILKNLAGVYSEKDLKKRKRRQKRKKERVIKMHKEGWSISKLSKLNGRSIKWIVDCILSSK